jgi:hypothetical protein
MGNNPHEKKSRFKYRVPTLETLENRMLTTVENLELQLQEINSPPPAPEVSAVVRVVNNSSLTLAVPRLTRQITANTSRVGIDRSVSLSVLATDAAGERGLTYRWNIDTTPVGGSATFSLNSSNSAKSTKMLVTKAGEYRVTVTITNRLGLSTTSTLRIQVAQAISNLVVTTDINQVIQNNSTLSVASNVQSLRLKALDQFGDEMGNSPAFNVSARLTTGNASAVVTRRGDLTDITFDRIADYKVAISTGRLVTNFTVRVLPSVAKVEIAAPTAPIAAGATFQLSAQAYDQFGRLVTGNFEQVWSTDAGSISNKGLFTAPLLTSTVNVTLRSGNLVSNLSLNVAGALMSNRINSPEIANLFSQYFADGSINRTEMMAILRLPGKDGVVDATELGDLKHIVNNSRLYNIPDYVQNLASDVVNGNAANQTFQGRALGNLTAGSTAATLNTLVDKWFLGADVPALTSSNYTYQYTAGNLFNGTANYLDQRQGMLGDCYFISAVGSLAYVNPAAVTNMFIDNGDGTFTVRFYGGKYGAYFNTDGTISDGFASGTQGVADYVTVDRRLPIYGGSRLAYSGYGSDFRSASNPLWIALAEKAYAQWNQTGNAGRNGANTFAAIEGGWMATVYAQVTGKNATDYWFNNTPKQTLINALNSGQAVTLGTKTGALGGGLVQGHAYMVKGYDAATDKFTLHNPWGTSHPTPLNYTQLQQFCSVFVVANSSGTSPIAQLQSKTNVRNDMYMEALAASVNQQRTIAESESSDEEASSPLSGQSNRLSLVADSQNSSDLVDIELAMLDQIRRDVGEMQEYVSLSMDSSPSDLALTAAIDELFAQPSLFN